jgi:viologen exporter family transport system permease protein
MNYKCSSRTSAEGNFAKMSGLRKYWAIFQTTLVNSLAYPGELIGRSLMILPFMWIYYQLWKVTFTAAGTDAINGLSLHDTMWYLLMAETIELSRSRVVRTIAENVKDGSIAYLLNKPYDFMLYQFSVSMGETVFRAFMTALCGGAIVWWLAGPPPTLVSWPLTILAVLGAWVLNFTVNGMIGLAAFVSEEVAPFEWIYQKFSFIFGGLLIPLDFYPKWLQTISFALPFPAMTYGPSRLFVTPEPSLFWSVLTQQAIWILVLGLLLTLAYRRGLAYLTVNGG